MKKYVVVYNTYVDECKEAGVLNNLSFNTSQEARTFMRKTVCSNLMREYLNNIIDHNLVDTDKIHDTINRIKNDKFFIKYITSKDIIVILSNKCYLHTINEYNYIIDIVDFN